MVKQVHLQFRAKAQLAGSGFILVEMMIAMALLVVSLTSIVVLAYGSQMISIDSFTNDEAIKYAQDQLESARISARANFGSVVSSSSTSGIYTKTLTVGDYDCLKYLNSTITWNRDNRPQTTTLQTYLTNPAEAFRFGGDCKIGFPGQWIHPALQYSTNLSPGGNDGTAIDVYKINGVRYVFLSTKHSSSGSNDIWAFNLSTLSSPTLADSQNTGEGLVDLDVAKAPNGNYYVYAAQYDRNKQLQVIEVTDPTNLTAASVKAEKKLISVNNQEGLSIAYYDQKVYAGVKANSQDEFVVYDVTDPTNPTNSSSWHFSVNQDVNDIQVRNEVVGGVTKTYAYLALSVSNSTDQEVWVVDVTNPASMSKIAGISIPGTASAYTISLIGSKLYVGRDKSSDNELYIYDVANPASPVLKGSANINISNNTAVSSIVVIKDLLFMGTSDSNDAFQVWKVGDPTFIERQSTTTFSHGINDLDYVDDLVVASLYSWNAFITYYDQDNPPQ